MKANQMLIITNMLEKIIYDIDDLKLTITEMKMKEVEANGGFMEDE